MIGTDCSSSDTKLAPTSTPTAAPSDPTTPPTAAPSEPTTTPSNYPSESPTTTPYIAVTRIGTYVLIDNPSDKDAFIAGNFFFETSDGTTVTRYQSSAFCVSDDVSLPSGSQAYKTDTTCQSGIGESGHIFESVMIGSAYYAEPSKQLIHFDTSRPDDGIRDALWEDGTSVSTLSYDYNCAELIPYTAGSPLYT
eukprot:111503_1